MHLSYDLPFIRGTIPSFANLSQMLLRPRSTLLETIALLELIFPDTKPYRVTLRGEIETMIKVIGHELCFPYDVSHSLDAFGDLMMNLSWLNSKHIIIVLEITDDTSKLDQCMIIDSISLAITHLNLDRQMQLSVLIIL